MRYKPYKLFSDIPKFSLYDQCWCCVKGGHGSPVSKEGRRKWYQLDSSVWNMHPECASVLKLKESNKIYLWKTFDGPAIKIEENIDL